MVRLRAVKAGKRLGRCSPAGCRVNLSGWRRLVLEWAETRWRNTERLMVSSSSRGNAGRSWSVSEVEEAKNGDRIARDRSWPARQPHLGTLITAADDQVGSGRSQSIVALRTCERSESVPI